MSQNPDNLIWIDLEMTGLDTRSDAILEIATIVTDRNLEVVEEGPVLTIHQPDAVLEAMDEWNKAQHGQSGLLKRVRASHTTEAEAEHVTLEFLKRHVPPQASPMCGNSICQDRRFLHRLMPELECYFHYRHLDVSTIKELARRWAPSIAEGFHKASSHLALADVRDSIRELRYYRGHFFKLGV
jgi:Oligoribonuclease (3''->5'' exoribonuclease)